MGCYKCGKPAVITLNEVGDLCPDCYNAWAAESKGFVAEFEYPKIFHVMDPSGDEVRTFEIYHLNFGRCITWNAIEKPTGYVIEGISYPDDDPQIAVERFLEKIKATVQTKTLDPEGNLKMQGTLNIVYDTNTKSPAVSINGKVFSMEALGELLNRFEGSQLQYRIIDRTAPVLSENEMLIPVKACIDDLLEEFDKTVGLFEDGPDFISEEDVFNLRNV